MSDFSLTVTISTGRNPHPADMIPVAMIVMSDHPHADGHALPVFMLSKVT
ncbi:hypothetical protein [Xenorhabdus sp. PB30.3]|nr:hypothetical protein [Xenorhabdus sp. PB30.3]MCC8379106.1 hypothetical protein [Xenorhabdus sp. PB30.3]